MGPERPRHRRGWGTCRLAATDGAGEAAEPASLASAMATGGAAVLLTAPDFGCVQWEPLPRPGAAGGAAILEAPEEEPVSSLAERLGLGTEAVRAVRKRLLGGSCPVRWVPCAGCGGPMVRRPGNAPRAHKGCRLAARRAYLAGYLAAKRPHVRAQPGAWIARHRDRVRARAPRQ